MRSAEPAPARIRPAVPIDSPERARRVTELGDSFRFHKILALD